ncbi:Fis family transcriptional regulator [Blastococcus sp. TF02-09]|uniref:sigma-54-dependent Fis family transcriptional regulator n=1 Tax=Blastococcus sp. TF02-09 TaxID=2250576 RepID=UPI000DE85143|nr:helix-turn-helix domain-containing protein [Blastococcus sp. TF02-9]RBY78424.1 Fis family transcriptional regulator [Blastococcus sp. TF02-9]
MTRARGADDDVQPDAHGLADTRIRFLTAEEPRPPEVRPPILASWRRSRSLKVAADRIELPYERDPDLDTPLSRSADQILHRLHEQMSGQPISIVLTDPTGLVLSRRTGDSGLERHLDGVLLAPGFNYAEQFVGTNGIGTALEAGSATQVFGHEHYAENLEDLACAGAPIHDPISGRLVGLVDLTCWRRDAETLLLTLAKNTADQIQHALLVHSEMREFAVLQAYRQTCRRTSGIVFAVSPDAVTMNDHARAELQPSDQAALLAQAVETGGTLPAGRRRSVEIQLPTGAPARMYCQQVDADSELAGLVVHVKIGKRASGSPGRSASPGRMLLPGLVGAAPSWQRACREVEAAATTGTWLALQGEPGVGKSALLRAVQLRRRLPGRHTVLDAEHARVDPTWTATLRQSLVGDAMVVIAHLDALDAGEVRSVTAALQEARRAPEADRPQVAVTVRPGADRVQLAPLLSYFPTSVPVPPLRLRLDDLATLVRFFLSKVGSPGQQLSCSPEAMRLLMRHSWPGNVQELQTLLHQVVQHRRSGSIEARDLPPGLHSTSRRVLSALESMERDAIVRSLADTNGNKVQAARSLGMSRATIYRKIHEFGIITPT